MHGLVSKRGRQTPKRICRGQVNEDKVLRVRWAVGYLGTLSNWVLCYTLWMELDAWGASLALGCPWLVFHGRLTSPPMIGTLLKMCGKWELEPGLVSLVLLRERRCWGMQVIGGSWQCKALDEGGKLRHQHSCICSCRCLLIFVVVGL